MRPEKMWSRSPGMSEIREPFPLRSVGTAPVLVQLQTSRLWRHQEQSRGRRYRDGKRQDDDRQEAGSGRWALFF